MDNGHRPGEDEATPLGSGMMIGRVRVLVLAAVLSLVAGLIPGGAAVAGKGPGKPVTAMTRNLYLGADINRPVLAALAAQAAGKTPQEIVVALGNATYVTRSIVDQTRFDVRAGLLADEIDRTKPDLIGLQEVALWRSGPLQLDQVGVANATTVDYDFLTTLLSRLAARGERYTAVSVGDRADVEAPSFTGSPFSGTIGADARDVRLTMRDVVLMRDGRGLRATGSGGAIYAHNLTVQILTATLSFDRGYQWVDVRAGSTRFRFVNTHLEAFSSDLALAQATELLANATATRRSTVFVCDCNSDPLNDSVKPQDHVPHKAPYELITGAGGYTDQWLEFAPAEEGWTSGLSELVNDPTAAGFDHRIDMIFGRTAKGRALRVDRGQVTGTDVSDRDPATGLWPSDHGGVVLRLRGL
jgi:endonuclease/exonuclease/phosphatase family metal-dependent hydrolase